MVPMFIVVDGLDGSGKTTIIEALTVLFEERGLPIVKTKSVGAGEMGMAIRKRILNAEKEPTLMLTTLGMVTCLYEMYSDVAIPALSAGKSVIVDRYLPSLLAYQKAAMGSPYIEPLIAMVFPQNTVRHPDLYIYCKVDVETSTKRLINRGNLDNYDNKTEYFKQKLYDAYENLADCNPAKTTVVLDCSKPLEQVLLTIINKFNKEINLRKCL